MRILLILTGGTIQSARVNGFFSADAQNGYLLVEKYCETYGQDNIFDIVSPYTILSENLDCRVFGVLCNEVSRNLTKNYDGIIITHGSDTLQYTAAVLDYVFADAGLPVLIVASNYILDDDRANGLCNFAAAVELIRNKAVTGVFVPYRNSDGAVYVHKGNYLLPHCFYRDDLYSINDCFFGKICNSQLELNRDFPTEECRKTYEIVDNADACSHVLWIKSHPGNSYEYRLEGIRAILLEGYHSGTLCTEGAALKDFAKRAAQKNIKMYIISPGSGMEYESCSEYDAMGIIRVKKASPIAIYIRLWFETAGRVHYPPDTCVAGDYYASSKIV